MTKFYPGILALLFTAAVFSYNSGINNIRAGEKKLAIDFQNDRPDIVEVTNNCCFDYVTRANTMKTIVTCAPISGMCRQLRFEENIK